MKKLRFLVPLHTRENDFQVAQGQSAEIAARKLGVDGEIVFADNDAVNQSAQLLKAIQGRVESRADVIVVEATRQKVKEQIERWCELFPDKLPGGERNRHNRPLTHIKMEATANAGPGKAGTE